MPLLQHAYCARKAAWPELIFLVGSWRKETMILIPSLQVWSHVKASKMANDEKYRIPAGQFNAGNHWCQPYVKNGLSLRQKITLTKQLPEDYEQSI